MLFKFNRLAFLFVILSHAVIVAQSVEVIDKKGTRVTVKNNTVTTSPSAPSNPVENDVWLDSSDSENTRPKVWTGSAWASLDYSGTPGSIFYTGPDNNPTQDNSNLYWDSNNSRLGLGTNAPDTRLDINGTTKIRNLPAGTGSDQIVTADTNGNLRKLPIATLETKTTITQNTTNGVITHNSEDGTSQTVNVVSANANNSISAGTDGGAFFNNPIKAYGILTPASNSFNAVGISGAVKNATGRFTFTFATPRSTSNYPIQLTVLDNTGISPVHIYVTSQNTTSFSMAIVDDSGLLGSFSYVDKTFYFTVLDF